MSQIVKEMPYLAMLENPSGTISNLYEIYLLVELYAGFSEHRAKYRLNDNAVIIIM